MGSLSTDLDEEWPIWRIVLEGQPLSEVSRWDLEDVEKYNALLDMKDDLGAAYQQWDKERIAKENDRR